MLSKLHLDIISQCSQIICDHSLKEYIEYLFLANSFSYFVQFRYIKFLPRWCEKRFNPNGFIITLLSKNFNWYIFIQMNLVTLQVHPLQSFPHLRYTAKTTTVCCPDVEGQTNKFRTFRKIMYKHFCYLKNDHKTFVVYALKKFDALISQY